MKRFLSALCLILAGAIIAVLTLYILRARMMPSLEPWHRAAVTEDIANELDSFRRVDLSVYLEREKEIFDRLSKGVAAIGPRGPAARWNRFNPDSASNPANRGQNWNRSFELAVEKPKGGAFLVHGLSDSPYSMRTIGEIFHDEDFHSLALRMPGHGTIPGGLRTATWRDFRAAYRLGVEHVAAQIGPDRPLVLVGYSNGAALAIDYAVRALRDEVERSPDLVILISPAMQAPSVAAYAYLQRWMSKIPGLEKLAWTDILPEYDPYKYNSFPVYAGEQIYSLTSRLQKRMVELAESGDLDRLPPILVFQSRVDATIAPITIVDGLLGRLKPGHDSQLVVFDINRYASVEPFLTRTNVKYLDALEREDLPATVTLVTNASEDSQQVVARTRKRGSDQWSIEPLDLHWPGGVYSLSHVALPFPPDDPLYGAPRPEDELDLLQLGAMEQRGEKGVFGVPMSQLARLRYNPFFPYLETRIRRSVSSLAVHP
jgi:alpha-beta hydrolase superfamily lysophospholipase